MRQVSFTALSRIKPVGVSPNCPLLFSDKIFEDHNQILAIKKAGSGLTFFRIKLPSLSLPQIFTPDCFSVDTKDFDREPFYTVIPQSILSGSGNGGVSGHVASIAALL